MWLFGFDGKTNVTNLSRNHTVSQPN